MDLSTIVSPAVGIILPIPAAMRFAFQLSTRNFRSIAKVDFKAALTRSNKYILMKAGEFRNLEDSTSYAESDGIFYNRISQIDNANYNDNYKFVLSDKVQLTNR